MHRLRNAILWTLLITIMLVGVIVILGALNDTDGQPLVENPGALLGSLFTSLGLVATGIFAIVTKSERASEETNKDTKAIRDQLENAHVQDPTKVSNIRDDLDTKASKDDLANIHISLERVIQEELAEISKTMVNAFTSLDRRIEGSASDIRGMRKDIRQVRETQEKMEIRMDSVERITGSIPLILAGKPVDAKDHVASHDNE